MVEIKKFYQCPCCKKFFDSMEFAEEHLTPCLDRSNRLKEKKQLYLSLSNYVRNESETPKDVVLRMTEVFKYRFGVQVDIDGKFMYLNDKHIRGYQFTGNLTVTGPISNIETFISEPKFPVSPNTVLDGPLWNVDNIKDLFKGVVITGWGENPQHSLGHKKTFCFIAPLHDFPKLKSNLLVFEDLKRKEDFYLVLKQNLFLKATHESDLLFSNKPDVQEMLNKIKEMREKKRELEEEIKNAENNLISEQNYMRSSYLERQEYKVSKEFEYDKEKLEYLYDQKF
jgi:hypothetical protein